MEEKITLDMLTAKSVSVKRQNYTTVDGREYAIGLPSRCAYINSTRGRAALESEVASPYKEAVFAVWGDTATVDETAE